MTVRAKGPAAGGEVIQRHDGERPGDSVTAGGDKPSGSPALTHVVTPLADPDEAASPPTGRPPGRFERACSIVDVVIEGILYLTLFGELAVLFGDVVTRQFFGFSLQWSDEVAQLALVVMAFVGGAFAYSRNQHSSVLIVVRKLPDRLREAQPAFASLAVISISVVVGVVAIRALPGEWANVTPILGLHESYYTIPIIFGMAVLVLQGLRQLVRQKKGQLLLGGVWFVAMGAIEFGVGVLGQHVASGSVAWSSAMSLGTFVLLLVMGLPIAFVLMISGTLYLFSSQVAPINSVVTNLSNGVTNDLLLAIPFFVTAGLLLAGTGMSGRLIRFVHSIAGRARGGILQTIVATMYIFSGISGSKVADVAAIGSPIVESVGGYGYEREDVAAVLASSAVMGEAVPPSIAMIVLASVTSIPVGSLFLAGIVPAAAIGLLLIGMIYLRARRKGEVAVKMPLAKIWQSFLPAAPVLVIPILLVAGIVGGFASAEEMSSIAVILAVILALVYRVLSFRVLREVLRSTVSMAGLVLLIVASANNFSWSLTVSGVPARISDLFSHFGDSRAAILIATIIIVPIIGSVLEGMPAVLVFGPLLVPIAIAAGISPLQYGIIFVMALGLGTFAPPLGVGLFATCAVCEVPMEKVARRMWPFWVTIAGGLVVLALVPALSTWLPGL